MSKKLIRKGYRVCTTGYGRTNKWPKQHGRVTKKRGNSVFVQWDNTHFEDEMDKREVEQERR